MQTLILDLVHCFVRARNSLLSSSVKKLNLEEFNAVHHTLDGRGNGSESMGGDLLITESVESSEGGEEVEDDEIMALQDTDFCD